MLDNSPSRNLRLYGQAQLVVQIILGTIGFAFCIMAALMDGPIMSPLVYGDVLTSIHAEWYSWPLFISALIYTLGILINGNWRFSPALRLFSALTQAIILWVFFVLAFDTSSIDPFILGSAILGGFNIWFIGLNTADTLRAIKGRRIV